MCKTFTQCNLELWYTLLHYMLLGFWQKAEKLWLALSSIYFCWSADIIKEKNILHCCTVMKIHSDINSAANCVTWNMSQFNQVRIRPLYNGDALGFRKTSFYFLFLLNQWLIFLFSSWSNTSNKKQKS
jgi:hypothetical protein